MNRRAVSVVAALTVSVALSAGSAASSAGIKAPGSEAAERYADNDHQGVSPARDKEKCERVQRCTTPCYNRSGYCMGVCLKPGTQKRVKDACMAACFKVRDKCLDDCHMEDCDDGKVDATDRP